MTDVAAKAVTDVVSEVRRRPPRAGGVRVLAVDGRSGSGKSTFARVVAGVMGAPIVSLENLYGGWHGLCDGIDRLVGEVLAPLARTGSADVPHYDWWRGRWDRPWLLAAPDVLVVEGCGAAHRRVAESASLTVWLDLDEPTRRARASARDHGLFKPFWDVWAAQEDAVIAEDCTPRRADVVLDASLVLDGLVDAPVTPLAREVRHTVRVLLSDPVGAVLLLEMRDPATGRRAWSAPGGGIEPGEDARAAARREVAEETGLVDFALGPEIWRRHEAIVWDGQPLSYRERWFFSRVARFPADLSGLSAVERTQVVDWRWWSPRQLAASDEATVPDDLPKLLAELLAKGPPPHPQYR